jgi:cob(I)alamin adenosyltransferase
MKIYTRKGDKGKTTLAGGSPVKKTHIRIEAYGSVDELIAHIALLHDLVTDPEQKAFLMRIEERLMTCAAILATECVECPFKVPQMKDSDITVLEKAIDAMEKELEPLRSFVLPGGHPVSSQGHVARTVCRRAERQIIRLSDELFVPEPVIKYINRLSDYLFVLSRRILHDNGIEDIPWKPEL